ncbi:hypothetical protein HanRHA438_Chr10g0443081 [Helianthus annuus]|nr:hypothetical protein HanRHA438_Chr10g0443081 [Helianthus annuus]
MFFFSYYSIQNPTQYKTLLNTKGYSSNPSVYFFTYFSFGEILETLTHSKAIISATVLLAGSGRKLGSSQFLVTQMRFQ